MHSEVIIQDINIALNGESELDVNQLTKQILAPCFNTDIIFDIVKDIEEIFVSNKYYVIGEIIEQEPSYILNVLFMKYENLFEKLKKILDYYGVCYFIPSHIKILETCRHIIESKDQLQLKALRFQSHGSDNHYEKVNINFNFKTLKHLGVEKYYDIDLSEMDSLETCQYSFERKNQELTLSEKIIHLDCLDGYTGYGKLPKSINQLYYIVNNVVDIDNIELNDLTLWFRSPIPCYFKNDTVKILKLQVFHTLNDIDLNFPNITELEICYNDIVDNDDLFLKMIDNSINLEKISIINYSEKNNIFHPNILHNDNTKSLTFFTNVKKMDPNIICSSKMKSLSINSPSNILSLNTPSLQNLDIYSRCNKTVLVKSDSILNELTIALFDNIKIDLSELKTEKLYIHPIVISSTQTMNTELILPSFYRYLKIANYLSQSWLNDEVEILELSLFKCDQDQMFLIDCDIINALYLKKLIVNNHIEWQKYINVSNECEIILNAN